VLILTDINTELLKTVVAEITAAGGRVAFSDALDVADHDAVTAFANAVHDEVGAMDIVMNVAGISTWGRIQDLEHHHWRRTVEIDLMGPIHIMESFIPAMIDAGNGGHLVNVSSAAGLLGLPLHAPYSAAKFGLRGVSEVLRFDLERYGIGVTLVCPGGVDTPLVGTVEIVGIDRAHPKVQRAMTAFQRHSVTPESAARAIIKGVKRKKYLVFTSPDIRLGFWAQRWFPPGYRFAMRKLNSRAQHLLDQL
ncbi:MAG: SDR family oxidoreductase, partial [Aeromicrobium sp.]